MKNKHISTSFCQAMCVKTLFIPVFISLLCLFVAPACNNHNKNAGNPVGNSPGELQQKAIEFIRHSIENEIRDKGRLGDSTLLSQPHLVTMLYEKNNFTPVWCNKEKWLPAGDSVCRLIEKAQLYGLFPEDYHVKELTGIREKMRNDSAAMTDRKNAALWSKADMLITDAFVQIIKDVKLGRLPNDSITLRKDSVLRDDFYQQQYDALQQGHPLTDIIGSLEPKHKGYQLLKAGIPEFLDKADYRQFTLVPTLQKNTTAFAKALQKRLYEGGYISFDSVRADSGQLAAAIRNFQKEKGITVDGRAGDETIRILNTTDREKFIRIAISMDKYKMLPEKMPSKYIWVNIAANVLYVIEKDSVKLTSKTIAGKPQTRTPLLNSAISALITYPKWMPPPSIIIKEILPALKKSPGYLERKGFTLFDAKGEEVDPYSVDWSKYTKYVPYRIVQGSGDANALGIFKFHFDNKYSVYLHDTNQRYLFGRTMRWLSHGCVRVQEWKDLAFYILRNDSVNNNRGGYTKIDSVKTWLKNKQKRNIGIRNKIPIFIRYFTCEGQNGNIVFYDDVYGEDRTIREKYFKNK